MRKSSTGKLAIAALMCALTAVLAQIQIPLPPIPVNLALLGAHLAGCLLGWRMGAAAMAVYMTLGFCGMPVFAGFAGGPSALFGPTGGFIAGYILCAWAEGKILRRFSFSFRSLALSMLLGTATCYLTGILWFSFITGSALQDAISVCMLPFLPGDFFKILLGARLCLRLQKPLYTMGVKPDSP